MNNFIFYVISILFTFAAAASNSKDINYDTPVRGIVNDLIENWESPFAYLKSRGYLSKDLPSSPDLQDFQQQLQCGLIQKLPFQKDSKRGLEKKENNLDPRALRSSDETKHEDLKNMFFDLFSSQNESASDELKSKLNVDWDMNALKYSSKEIAEKYFKSINETGEKKDQVEEPFKKKRLAQDPLLKKRLAEDSPLKKRVAQDPPLNKRLAQDPQLKKRLAEDSPLNKRLAEDSPFKKRLAEDSPLKKRVAQDPSLNNRLVQDPELKKRLAEDSPFKKRLAEYSSLKSRLAEDPQLKKRLARYPQLKKRLVQDFLYKHHLNLNNPKFPKVLRCVKRAIERSKMRKK